MNRAELIERLRRWSDLGIYVEGAEQGELRFNLLTAIIAALEEK